MNKSVIPSYFRVTLFKFLNLCQCTSAGTFWTEDGLYLYYGGDKVLCGYIFSAFLVSFHCAYLRMLRSFVLVFGNGEVVGGGVYLEM